MDKAREVDKAYMRSRYGGTRELDLLLAAFEKEDMAALSQEEWAAFEALLARESLDLMDLLLRPDPEASLAEKAVLKRLQTRLQTIQNRN